MRVIRGLAALVALVVALGAVPVFLVTAVGNPLPARLSWERVVAGLTRPDDGSILVGLIAVVAWIAWAVFAVSVLTELVALLSRQRIRLRLPGLGPSQRLASGLLVAVVSLVVVTPQLSQATPAGATPVPAAPATVHDDVAAPLVVEPAVGPVLMHDGDDDTAEPPSASPPPSGVRHVVQRGDDLWSLAERYYGQGRDWRKIAAANPDRLTGGPDRLAPGWRLVIPDVDRSPTEGTVVVARGETLSSIAERLWSDPERWPELYEANRFQLADPDDLAVGLRLTLPKGQPDGRELAESGPTSRTGTRAPADGGSEAGSATDEADAEPSTGREPDALPRPHQPTTQAEPGPTTQAEPASTTGAARPAPPPAAAPSATSSDTSADTSAHAPTSAPVTESSASLAPLVAGLAGVGGLLAAAVVSGVALRRRAQLQVRPVGRRIWAPSPAAQLAEAHLGRRQQPMGLRTLDLATRAIAAHCHRTGDELPALVTAAVHPDRLELVLAEPCDSAPNGFRVDGRRWTLAEVDVDRLRSIPGLSDAVRPYPALVTLGVGADGEQVVADLEQLRLTSVDAVEGDLAGALLAAIAVELSCSPWAEELELVVIGTCEQLPAALGRHTVTRADELTPVLDRLARRARLQRSQFTGSSVAAHRVDPDLADPWVPTIVVISRRLSAEEQLLLREVVLAEPPVSIAAVAANLTEAPMRIAVSGSASAVVARVEPSGQVITPQLLGGPAADAIIELVEATGRTDTTPAPWWFDGASAAEPDPPDNVTYLGRRFGGWAGSRHEDTDDEQGGGAMDQQQSTPTSVGHHPLLQLLGPVELDGAAGAVPSRAAKQCLEYCAWLLEHPGTTAQAMGAALAVAEGTRRSNMSRLRSWLGADDLDQPYLPDAYSGRIMLHASVSSDWQRLQILTGRGVNQTSSSGLETALQLVRGAPLADAAPGQWHWAEGLRTDMISVIRDIGVELAQRALDDSDIELARWAAARALAAAPGDELLLVARIRTEHRAGNHPEVERLTLQLAAHARTLEVDLRPETVDVLQQMMEGRVRARLA